MLTAIGYTGLYIFVMAMIGLTYRNGLLRMGLELPKVKKRLVILIAAFGIWAIYLYLIGESGLLWHFEMPPRFLLMIFLPIAIITVFIFIKNRKSPIFEAIPKQKILYFQSFRIVVELVILATYLEGVFPVETTFEGYNYEIIVAILAPIVAYAVYSKKWLSENVALAFNYLGLATLAIIIFIVITSLYFPSVWGNSAPRIAEEFSHVPYLLLPGFLAPAAIFAHIFSIMQIRKTKQVKG
ncbi:MAG: hypothetical protein GQ574_18405 [Crocinitomix sp.]|nr:hypothetical protein [Crocinitomix sp.]